MKNVDMFEHYFFDFRDLSPVLSFLSAFCIFRMKIEIPAVYFSQLPPLFIFLDIQFHFINELTNEAKMVDTEIAWF